MRLKSFAILFLICILSVIRGFESLPINDSEYFDIVDVLCTEGYVMDGQGNCVPISDPINPGTIDYCDFYPQFC